MNEASATMRVEVDLLRHGEPLGGRRYRGWRDDPLTERGWRQMQEAVAGQAPWQRVLSSPLSRCRTFAQHLARELGVPLEVDERWKEIGFGLWEGRSAAELRARDPHCLRRFYHDPVGAAPPGFEGVAAFMARVQSVWEEVLARHPGERLLVVTHAGVMRAVVAHLLGAPPGHLFRLHVGHAALLRIRGDGERPPALQLR